MFLLCEGLVSLETSRQCWAINRLHVTAAVPWAKIVIRRKVIRLSKVISWQRENIIHCRLLLPFVAYLHNCFLSNLSAHGRTRMMMHLIPDNR